MDYRLPTQNPVAGIPGTGAGEAEGTLGIHEDSGYTKVWWDKREWREGHQFIKRDFVRV
jgi:hypothetical protein